MDDEHSQPGEESSPFQVDDLTGAPYRTVKDSVFKWLFAEPDNLLQLYQTLHPEDTQTRAEDLDLVTLETIIVKDIHNDLGFAVGSRLVILAEAQSTWSVNIILRSLFYLARTYQNYLSKTSQNLYNTKAVSLPKAELYVIYSGPSPVEQTEITLSEEFFHGEPSAVEVTVKVIVEKDSRDIINQYILFSKIIDEQIELYGRTPLAVQETIRICKDRDILRKFLEQHEKEAVDIMVQLYSQREAVTDWGRSRFAEGRREGEQKANMNTVKRLYKRGMALDEIAEAVGVSIDQVKAWLK